MMLTGGHKPCTWGQTQQQHHLLDLQHAVHVADAAPFGEVQHLPPCCSCVQWHLCVSAVVCFAAEAAGLGSGQQETVTGIMGAAEAVGVGKEGHECQAIPVLETMRCQQTPSAPWCGRQLNSSAGRM
jgi:hypothetical protein